MGWGDASVYEPSVVVKKYHYGWKKPKRQVSWDEAGVSAKPENGGHSYV
jgi:hypothetical protein